MRRWLIVLLLIVLPMQFAVASVLDCYQLTSTETLRHTAQLVEPLGLIDVSEAASALDDSSHTALASIDFDHCECSACHMPGAQAGASIDADFSVQRDRPAGLVPDRHVLDVARAIDRPNWSRAA